MAAGKVAKSLAVLCAAALVAGVVWPRLADNVAPGGGDRVAYLRTYLPASVSNMLPAYETAAQKQAAQTTGGKPGPGAGGPPGGRGGPGAGGPGGRPPAAVVVGRASRGPLPFVIETVGTAQPVATVALRTRVDSYIEQVLVPDGAAVKAGDILVKLDDRQILAQIKQAEAQLAKDRTALDQAERDVRRFTELVAKNAGTQLNLENAKTAVASAKALIAGDQAQIDNLKVQLSYLTIRTPISGRVGTFSAKAGNIIRAGDNSTTGALGTVVQMSPIYITFSLAQRLLPEMRTSITDKTGFVEATPQGSSRSVRGRIALLDNTIDPATGTISIRAEFENADEFLWPGQLCNLRIVLRTDPDVVSIPRDATQSGQAGNFVFAVENGAAVVKPVKVLRTQDGRDIIETGLTGNETVVTDGALSLVNGARVQIRNATAKRDS